MIFGIKKMYHFDPYNILLTIATNIPQRLKTGFVLQGHIYHLQLNCTEHGPYINATTTILIQISIIIVVVVVIISLTRLVFGLLTYRSLHSPYLGPLLFW